MGFLKIYRYMVKIWIKMEMKDICFRDVIELEGVIYNLVRERERETKYL